MVETSALRNAQLQRIELSFPLENSETFVLPPPHILLYSQGSEASFQSAQKLSGLMLQAINLFNSLLLTYKGVFDLAFGLQCSPTPPSRLQQMGPPMKALSPRIKLKPFLAHSATSSQYLLT